MKNIIVASQNQNKIKATHEAFLSMFPDDSFEVSGVTADSGVSSQPMTSDETLEGARNRVLNAKQLKPNADYWVGIEGGMDEVDGDMELMAWVVVRDKNWKEGKARSATCSLPKLVQQRLREGEELTPAWDEQFGTSDIGGDVGVVGYLTDSIITRKEYNFQPLVFALVPFKQEGVYE